MLDFNLRISDGKPARWLILKLLSMVVLILNTLWLALYRSGMKKSRKASKPVISIGNITMGGTGKSPMIDWILEYVKGRNIRPAVLTRGYKAEKAAGVKILDAQSAETGDSRTFGDEPWLIHKRHPDIRLYISPDRTASSRLAEKEADLLLLDDGMQHLKLNRDLNVVLIDSLSGIGNGQLFPLGPLREPLHSLSRADVIVFTRSNLAPAEPLLNRLQPFIPQSAAQYRSRYIARGLVRSSDGIMEEPDGIKAKRCFLFSGIGNPRSLEEIVSQLEGKIADHLVFSDHQDYDDPSLQIIRERIAKTEPDMVICTEKDWVKLERRRDRLPEFYWLKMKMEIDRGFEQHLDHLLEWSRKG